MATRIAYMVCILGSAGVYAFTGSPLALALLITLFLLAALLLGGVIVTRVTAKPIAQIPAAYTVGSTSHVRVSLKAPLPLPIALISFRIRCESLTFQHTGVRSVSIAPGTLAGSHADIPIDSKRYGRTRVTIEDAIVEDILGLFRVSLPFSARSFAIVFPRAIPLVVNMSQMPLSRVLGTSFDANRSGSDVDEVFDVREFQKGDHMASVHWKLSTKFDELMSREFSLPVDFELIVMALPSLQGAEGQPYDTEVLNAVASCVKTISEDLFQQGLQHSFAIPANDTLMRVTVDGPESMDAIGQLIVDAPIAPVYDDALNCMANSELAESFTKCILVTPTFDERLFVQLAHEMDLSVVYVTSDEPSSMQREEFTVVTIDIKEIEAHERAISL